MNAANEGRSLRSAAAVEPVGKGRYDVNLSPVYTVGEHPHGGYLQCVMASGALAGASDEGASHLHVTAISTNYVRSPKVSPAQLHVDVRRVGRGASFVYVALFQDDVLATESLVTLGTLHDETVVRYQDATPPDVAPLEECRVFSGGDEISIRNVIDQRLDPSCTRWRDGEVSTRGEAKGWIRLDDGEASWGPWSLLFASDALPPATFALGSSGWVPTLQLTSYVRRVPTSDWLRARQWAVVVAEGLVDERLELFDDADQLVASSSQLAMVRFPEGRST